MEIRFANEKDLSRVNDLRKQVNDLHVAGKPDVFKPGFNDTLRDYIYVILQEQVTSSMIAGSLKG